MLRWKITRLRCQLQSGNFWQKLFLLIVREKHWSERGESRLSQWRVNSRSRVEFQTISSFFGEEKHSAPSIVSDDYILERVKRYERDKFSIILHWLRFLSLLACFSMFSKLNWELNNRRNKFSRLQAPTNSFRPSEVEKVLLRKKKLILAPLGGATWNFILCYFECRFAVAIWKGEMESGCSGYNFAT